MGITEEEYNLALKGFVLTNGGATKDFDLEKSVGVIAMYRSQHGCEQPEKW